MQKEPFLSMGALVLASESPTRRKMLTNAGVNFIARTADVDEISIRESAHASSMPFGDIAIMLAEIKARKVAHDDGENPSGFVLGTDQILVCNNHILGKPRDFATAASQLKLLSGKKHYLMTAAVIYRDGERIWHHLETPTLTMRPLSDEFIDHYLLALGEAAFKSPGSYQVEGLGANLFSKVEGCYFAVLGLPLLEILSFISSSSLVLRGRP